jgi:hypothetical protein
MFAGQAAHDLPIIFQEADLSRHLSPHRHVTPLQIYNHLDVLAIDHRAGRRLAS